MKIFCDFDGTLCDVTKRHYRVYSEVTNNFGGKALDAASYWRLKRQKTSWSDLLEKSNLPASTQDEYLNDFRNLIEDPEYLKYDELYPGALQTLQQLSEVNDLVLVSLRRKPENLSLQLEWLGISKYFSKVLTAHSESDGYDKKIELIKREMSPEEQNVIVGDTEADIVTGNELGMHTIAVLSGIRDAAFLTKLNPNFVISDISQIGTVLTS